MIMNEKYTKGTESNPRWIITNQEINYGRRKLTFEK